MIEDNHTEIDTKIGIKIEGKQRPAGQYDEARYF